MSSKQMRVVKPYLPKKKREHLLNQNPEWARYLVEFEPTEVIFWEGESAGNFYIILDGTVEIRRRRPNGDIFVLATLGEGQFFGEMALLQKSPRTGTAMAKTFTRLLVLSERQLLKILGEDRRFAMKMIVMLTERLKKAGDQLVLI